MAIHDMEHKKESIVVFFIVILLFTFYVLTIRDGHVWGGDFALYITHALNLINGVPYTESGYIVNPEIPWVSPYAYPPVFPFILVPVAKLFGVDLFAFKILLITILCITLLLFHRLILNKLQHPGLRIFLIVLVGLSPWYWDYKDHILSEFPFILFFISFLLVTERYLKHNALSIKSEVTYGITIGILAYLAYGSRSIGLILIPVFIAAYILYRRQLRLALLISAAVFLIFYGIQNAILNTDATYTQMATSLEDGLHIEPDDKLIKDGTTLRFLIDNLTTYFFIMERFWENGTLLALRILTVIATSLMFLLGLFCLIRRPNISEIMIISYTGLLMIVPFNQGNRYLLPFLPFYLLYILKGTEDIFKFKRLPGRGTLSVLTLLLISFSYLGNYINKDFSDYKNHVAALPAKDLYHYINNNLQKYDIIAFKKPRVLNLYTHVKSFSYDGGSQPDMLWKNFKQLKATYILTINNVDVLYSKNIKKLLKQHANSLTRVYSNEQFKLYKIN